MASTAPVTAVGTPLTSAWSAGLASPINGQIILLFGSLTLGQIPTTVGAFSPGAIAINSAGTSASTNIFCNSGTAASPVWTALTIS